MTDEKIEKQGNVRIVESSGGSFFKAKAIFSIDENKLYSAMIPGVGDRQYVKVIGDTIYTDIDKKYDRHEITTSPKVAAAFKGAMDRAFADGILSDKELEGLQGLVRDVTYLPYGGKPDDVINKANKIAPITKPKTPSKGG